MRGLVLGAVLLGASAGASAQTMDWRTSEAQGAFHNGLTAAAGMCSDFGFTRAAAQPAAALRGKIGVHLLGADAPEAEINRWGEVVNAERALRDAANDPGRVERGDEALAAAFNDPAQLAPARQRFVDSEMVPLRAALDACTRAAAEPFIAANYFSGHGQATMFEDAFRAVFDEALKRIAERKAELDAKPNG